MVTLALWFLSLLAVLWLWILISPAHRWTFAHRLDSYTPLPEIDLPPVTVIIPARNEALMLPNTLPSICEQDYPNLKVILIDDQSEDDSPRILAQMQQKYPHLTVLHGQPRPAGWMGKCWAVKQAYDKSTTDYILFTDADVIYHPSALKQSMRLLLAEKIDYLTLFPRPTFGRHVERIAVAGLLALLALLFPMGRANNPRRKTFLGIGMFMLVNKKAYVEIGTHEAIMNDIVEDMALAKRFKFSGHKVHVRLTSDLLTTRMYDGWTEVWEGLTKNAYASLNFSPIRYAFMMTIGNLVTVFTPLYVIATAIWAIRAHSSESYVAVALSLWVFFAQALFYERVAKYLRFDWVWRYFMPASLGIYMAIGTGSMWQYHFGKGNRWKGRSYDKATLKRT